MKYNTISKEEINILIEKHMQMVFKDDMYYSYDSKKDLDLNKYPLPPKPPSPRIIKYDSKFEVFIANCIPYILLLIFILAFMLKCV